MFYPWLNQFRQKHQLPESFSIADIGASRATRPVRIESFHVEQECPLDAVPNLARLAMMQEGQPFIKWWHYFDAYDRELAAVAQASRNGEGDKPIRILEIGVWRGGSLSLWRNYFGDEAVIFGIDIDPESATWGTEQAEVRVGSQVDSAFLLRVIAEMGGLDIVIDDGSHQSKHVIETLKILWPHLSDHGIYIVEDLHTSYWPAWGGGLRRRTSSIEALKSLVDVLHQPYFESPADTKGLGITRDSLASISFYDSIAVLHKKRVIDPRPFHGGTIKIS